MISPEELARMKEHAKGLTTQFAIVMGQRAGKAQLAKHWDNHMRLIAEIERLRTALAWYADEDNYCESGFGYDRAWSEVQSDKGYRATEALGDK